MGTLDSERSEDKPQLSDGEEKASKPKSSVLDGLGAINQTGG